MAKFETDTIKRLIHKAFKHVEKTGIGVREANALDDYAYAEEVRKARLEDTEIHWWDIADDWRPFLGTALSFTDKEGFRFLLPAAMMADLDRVENGPGHSVMFHLALCNKQTREQGRQPHHGHPEYIDYLKSISALNNAEYYSLDEAQIHAVAEFLDWQMREGGSLLYRSRDEKLRSASKSNALTVREVLAGHYSLTPDHVMEIFDQECRIMRDWLNLGGVRLKPGALLAP